MTTREIVKEVVYSLIAGAILAVCGLGYIVSVAAHRY